MEIRSLIFITFSIVFQNGFALENPKVITPLGQIEGYIGYTVNNRPFYKFEGVPYSKPPVNDLRFEDPQDVEPWKGIWKANVLTRCMQYDHFTQDYQKQYVVHGDEDCLYVNIYTHSINFEENLNVLVHIHGGAFMFGRGASYGPDIIMDKNIVFVNLNYRLGPLGFLSTEDDVLPGNTGLKDQIKALKWIKDNIKYFGGNPEAITIHGLSAGGASVHLHYLMPPSKGLFKQGISQSGCALNPWVLAENVKEKTLKVADLVGCPPSNSAEIKNCLKTKPARHIVQTVKEFQPFLYNPFSPFGVVVDGRWAKSPLLPDHPYLLLKQGKVYDVPWMVSYTKEEGLYPAADFWADDQYLFDIDAKWNDIMPFILHYNETVASNKRDEVSQAIRKHYLGDNPVNRDSYSSLVDALSDRLFIADIEKAAKIQSCALKSDVFSYFYSYRGSVSLSEITSQSSKDLGVCHGDDTMLVLKVAAPFKKNELSTRQDKKVSNLLLDLTTSFMDTGIPNITSTWKPLSKWQDDPFILLEIGGSDKLKLDSKDHIGQSPIWDSWDFIISDRLFIADIELSAKLHNAQVSSNIYTYTFSYRGATSKSTLRAKSQDNLGVSHGDDTIYVLSSEFNTTSNDADKLMSKVLMDMVVSFMKFGIPNITSDWQPLKKSPTELYSQLKISGPRVLEMEFKDEIGQRRFWESLQLRENANYLANIKDEL